jgi:hypothetical protein
MIHFGLQCVTAGANPIAVKRGIDKTAEYLVGKLKENAKPVQGRNDIKVRGMRAGGRRGVARGAWGGGGPAGCRLARRSRHLLMRRAPARAPCPLPRTWRPSPPATTTRWAR